jgi:ubiquitin-protein ligase E3 B
LFFKVSLFLLHIMSVPGIIEHLNNIAPEILNSLLLQKQTHILAKAVKFLSQEQQLKIHFNALEGSYALCLTANLVHLVKKKTFYFSLA